MDEKLHTRVLEKLIQGVVICKWSDRPSMEYLDNAGTRDKVDAWLISLSMQTKKTPSEDGYYTVYLSTHARAREAAKARFKDIMDKIRFYVSAFEALMEATDPDRALYPGKDIHYSKLLDCLNNQADVRNKVAAALADSGRSKLKSSAASHVDQMDALLKALVDDGLLVLVNPQTRLYLVTAKWDIIQEMIEFIADHESVPDIEQPEDHQRQGDML